MCFVNVFRYFRGGKEEDVENAAVRRAKPRVAGQRTVPWLVGLPNVKRIVCFSRTFLRSAAWNAFLGCAGEVERGKCDCKKIGLYRVTKNRLHLLGAPNVESACFVSRTFRA